MGVRTNLRNYCNKTWKTVVEDLDTDISVGLTEEESKIRRSKFGDNEIKLQKFNSNVKAYIKSFLKVYLLIELIVCVFLFVDGNIFLGYVSAVVLLTNIFEKFVRTFQKQKETTMLQKINSITATVLRDGRQRVVKASELVKGDIVYFEKRSLIPADMRIIEANNIKVDEKNITGENFIKDKYESKITSLVYNLGEMKNILFKGSVIKEGEGFGVVIQTGDSTQLGKLLAMLIYASISKHILEGKIEKNLGKIMTVLCCMAISIFFIINRYEGSFENMTVALFVISTIPIGLLMSIISFLLKKDLSKDGIELINMSTLDYINDIEVIFLDKIGSITEEKMIVKKVYANDKLYNEEEMDYENDLTIKRLIDITLLSNNASYNIENDSGDGDLSEIAYLSLAARKKAYKSIVNGKHPRIFDIPMDSEEHIFTTVNKYKSGCRANVKGNVDAVIEKCTHIMIDGTEREITEDDKEILKAIDYNLSIEGLTIQAVAFRNFTYKPSTSENIESNLVFVGIIALENPFIEDAKKQIADIKRRGIVPILFTEDNMIAASTIGKSANFIADNNGVISGVELDSLTKEELISVLERVRVFSRVTPEIKGKIVALFTKDDYNIAASGETLGDLPSLSLAKVGIGKGMAPKTVKMISDVFIKKNYMQGFLKLFDISKQFKKSVVRALKILTAITIAQVLAINGYSFLNKDTLDFTIFIILNFIIVGPISIFNIMGNGKVVELKKLVLRTIVWTVVPLVCTFGLGYGAGEVFLLSLGGVFLEYTLMDSSIKIKNNKEVILLIVSIFLWIMGFGTLFLVHTPIIGLFNIVSVIISFIVYTVFELFIRRWK